MLHTINSSTIKNGTLPRVAPFALFMAFIAVEECLRYLAISGFVEISDSWFLYLYPVKTVAVGLLLFCYRNCYDEIVSNDLKKSIFTLSGALTGMMVFVLWVNMDWGWATFGTSKGFDPTLMSENFTRYLLISFRILGASIIVPIMEELFWRSWLLRYIISQNFQTVDIGKYSLPSFLIGTVMFGLEHNLWLAGIMAGIFYNLLLYRTKSIAQCIVAHAVTNLILGMYVLNTGRWEFW